MISHAPPARSLARTKQNDFPVGAAPHAPSPPQPPMNLPAPPGPPGRAGVPSCYFSCFSCHVQFLLFSGIPSGSLKSFKLTAREGAESAECTGGGEVGPFSGRQTLLPLATRNRQDRLRIRPLSCQGQPIGSRTDPRPPQEPPRATQDHRSRPEATQERSTGSRKHPTASTKSHYTIEIRRCCLAMLSTLLLRIAG